MVISGFSLNFTKESLKHCHGVNQETVLSTPEDLTSSDDYL